MGLVYEKLITMQQGYEQSFVKKLKQTHSQILSKCILYVWLH